MVAVLDIIRRVAYTCANKPAPADLQNEGWIPSYPGYSILDTAALVSLHFNGAKMLLTAILQALRSFFGISGPAVNYAMARKKYKEA
jgi:hypothetical protein